MTKVQKRSTVDLSRLFSKSITSLLHWFDHSVVLTIPDPLSTVNAKGYGVDSISYSPTG